MLVYIAPLFLANKLTKLIFKNADKIGKNADINRRLIMKNFLKGKKMTAAALAAAVLALTGLTACGGSQTSGNSAGGNSGSGMVEKISVGYFEGAYHDINWKSWEKLYNETHPNAKIELELEGDPAYGSAVENLLSTGEGPDIMVAPMTWRKHASRGWLEPLGEVYSADFGGGKTIEGALNDEIKDNLKFNGQYYAMPYSEYITGIAVNKGFFDEHGWELPVTMADMLDIIDKISELPENNDKDTENDIAPFAWSGVESQYYWNYVMNTWWANYGGIDEIKTFKKMESPAVYQTTAREKAVDALLTLIGGKGEPKNCAEGVVGMENLEAQLLFTSGKALMMPNASWFEIEMTTNLSEGFEMVLIAPPTIEGGSGEHNLYGHVDEWLVIPAAAENKEAAKKFVSFIFSEKGLIDFFETTNTTSVFTVDYSKVSAKSLTEFGGSVLSLRSSNNIFYSESSSPLMYMGLANFWQYKMVTQMVTEGQTAKEIVKYDYDHVVNDWSGWQQKI